MLQLAPPILLRFAPFSDTFVYYKKITQGHSTKLWLLKKFTKGKVNDLVAIKGKKFKILQKIQNLPLNVKSAFWSYTAIITHFLIQFDD